MFVGRASRVGIAAAAALLTCGALELLTRWIDGYAVGAIRLRSVRPRAGIVSSPPGKWIDPDQAASYVSALPVADGVDRTWFALNPGPVARPPLNPLIEARYAAHAGYELPSVYWWNREFLRRVACGRERASLVETFQHLDDVFAFDAASARPTYRFLPNTLYPSGLVTNEYGWRGRSIPLNKPANRIRVAFIGSSTTLDAHSDPFSYPEYVGRWLDAWATAHAVDATFDVVNAGREGITSDSIAAIVSDELLPVRPDVVVYYEGSNQFWPNAFAARPLMRTWRLLTPRPLAGYSALAVRAYEALDRRRAGTEPAKPPLAVGWPADLSEDDPPLDDARLPVDLPAILRDLDQIRAALTSVGATLVVSSFVWLVHPGMTLERGRDAFLYRYLNEGYWPFSYAHLRRFADFQNRVFRKYAATRHLSFIDLAAAYPRDAKLFTDAIHMTPAGVKLKAWLVFQQLIPVIQRKVAARTLPSIDPDGRRDHPAFAGISKPIAMDEIRVSCAAPR